jgi:hypothetical protein
MLLSLALLMSLSAPPLVWRLPADVAPPHIDGSMSDAVWDRHPDRRRYPFVQVRPDYGQPSTQDTEYAIAYDDRNVYVIIRMYDADPTGIPREITPRDQFSNGSDWVAIAIDTYGRMQNAYGFFVSAAGTQADKLFYGSGNEDDAWNAVWESAVGFDAAAWTVEMRIPLAAIRFPATNEQPWRVLLYRVDRRRAEESFQIPFDATQSGIVSQMQPVVGVSGVQPPLRLELYPYASLGGTRTEGGSASGNWSLGTDLRYGINEAFTLDMTLIPDFSHVKSDEQVLNLSVFDVRFDENRPFFTEGTELFDQYNLFYSRRIGEAYRGDEPPPLFNAFKVTGRHAGGTGLGVLNAVTQATDSGDPWMNYNILTVDQVFGQRNSVGILNTNVWRGQGERNANVSLLRTELYDRTNTWRMEMAGIVSRVTGNGAAGEGFRGRFELGNVRGDLRATYQADLVTTDYSVRDFGFQRSTNYLEQEVRIMSQDLEGRGPFQSSEAWINSEWEHRLVPFGYAQFETELGFSGRFRNNASMSAWLWSQPFGSNDYFDARQPGAVIARPLIVFAGVGFSSDNRKALSLRLDGNLGRVPDWGQTITNGGGTLNLRLNDRVSGYYALNASQNLRQRGGFSGNLAGTDVLIGRRDVRSLTHRAGFRVTPEVRSSLDVSLYRIRTQVDYDRYFVLGTDRTLTPTATVPTADPSRVFRYLALDANWQVQFAPGSFFSVTGKLLRETDPETANISARVIWYWSAR